MKSPYAIPTLIFAVWCIPVLAQTTENVSPDGAQQRYVHPPTTTVNGERKKDSGPLTWISSDVNPRTVFWIQGRFVPVGDSEYQGDAEVVTILCSIHDNECLQIEGTSPGGGGMEQVWIEEFKAASWDSSGILASGRSLDGCTDETLKIRFSPPSVVMVNSPVLPMSDSCREVNSGMDKIMGKTGWTITNQMEQDELVPTRALLPWADVNLNFGKVPTPAPAKKP